jgi:secondary thiamine-phosphate synthase enzyme
MKSFRKELWFEVPTRRALINITPKVEACLKESGIKEGLLLVNAMHITASAFINDDESGLHHDFEVWLEKLAPHEPVKQYHHNIGEDNADAHLKRQVMGREVIVAVRGEARFRPMGADFLWRVRRQTEEEGPRQNHRRISAQRAFRLFR